MNLAARRQSGEAATPLDDVLAHGCHLHNVRRGTRELQLREADGLPCVVDGSVHSGIGLKQGLGGLSRQVGESLHLRVAVAFGLVRAAYHTLPAFSQDRPPIAVAAR